ncbi:MAG: response regulator [Planctomycetes bacterium]|nr:response regulator [Planctomycetota bacterium]
MSAKHLVAVVSPDAAIGNALKPSFKAAGLTMATHGTVIDFIESVDRHKPVGCVVAEVHHGLELIKELADVQQVIPVVLLARQHNVTSAVQAIKAGAFDVVERIELIAESARKACAFFARCQKLVDERALAAKRIDLLTKRERQVLNLMVTGMPNRAIAAELGISTKTLDIHRGNLMEKMQARTATDMVRAYMLFKAHPTHLAIIGALTEG